MPLSPVVTGGDILVPAGQLPCWSQGLPILKIVPIVATYQRCPLPETVTAIFHKPTTVQSKNAIAPASAMPADAVRFTLLTLCVHSVVISAMPATHQWTAGAASTALPKEKS
jgi:hypothetical protein